MFLTIQRDNGSSIGLYTAIDSFKLYTAINGFEQYTAATKLHSWD